MFNKLYKFSLSVLVLTTVFSCVKDEDAVIGENLIDSEAFTNSYVDTFQINTSFKVLDSIKTTGISAAIIGKINDPVFGETKASLFTEFLPTKTKLNLSGSTFDSMFIELPYLDSYGDLSSGQEIKVYRVTEKIDTVKKYNFETYTYSDEIGTLSFTPVVKEVKDDKTTLKTLKIPINSAFGQEILDANTSVLDNADSFKEHFKGLALVSTSNPGTAKGNLLSFNYAKIKCWLYFKNSDNKSDSIDFITDSDALKLNHFTHDYQNSAIKDELDKKNTTNLYIQGMSGIETVLSIDNIDEIKEKLGEGAVINKANIQLFLDTDTLTDFPRHGGLAASHLTVEDDEDKYTSVIDLNGNLAQFNTEHLVYNVNVTRYLQDAIKTGEAKDIYLRVSPLSSIRRTILEGGTAGSGDKKMKLQILYSTKEN
jgi:hypothetical protein